MTNSPEYRTLTHCAKEVTDTIARDPKKVADWLLINGLIDSPTFYRVCESELNSEEKAGELLQWVRDKLMHSSNPSKVYKDFVFALGRNCGFAWSSDVLKSLEVQLSVQELSSGFEPKPKPVATSSPTKPTLQSTQQSTWTKFGSTDTEPTNCTTKSNKKSSYTPVPPCKTLTSNTVPLSTYTPTEHWPSYKGEQTDSSDSSDFSSEDDQKSVDTATQQSKEASSFPDDNFKPLLDAEPLNKPNSERGSNRKGSLYGTRYNNGLEIGSAGTTLFRRNVSMPSKPKEIYRSTVTPDHKDDDISGVICCLTTLFGIFLLIILVIAGLVIYLGPPTFIGNMVAWCFSATGEDTNRLSIVSRSLEPEHEKISSLYIQTLSIPPPTPSPKDQPSPPHITPKSPKSPPHITPKPPKDQPSPPHIPPKDQPPPPHITPKSPTPNHELLNARPSLNDLLNFRCPDQRTFNIAEKISIKFRAFGTIILNDERGELVSALEMMHNKYAVMINQEILQMWVLGKGIEERTWRALIGVLKRVELHLLAGRIETGVLARQ